MFFSSLSSTIKFVDSFIPNITKQDTIFLYGSLGSGKTTIARRIIQTLTKTQDFIQSPTFSLLQIYEECGWVIWHSDLYRIHHIDEIIELGIYDFQHSGLLIIEWPEILQSTLIPSITITITQSPKFTQEERSITIQRL